MTDPNAPDGEPPLLYKFLGVGPMSPPWKDRVEQLLTGHCYHPSASAFNDPFDCWPFAELPATKAEFEQHQDRLIASMAEAIRRDLPAAFVRDRIRENLAGKSIEDLDAGFQKGLRMNADATGVFCLAACIESMLMWSHYASSHAGVALRFDFRRQRRGGLGPLWKVRYQEDRPTLAGMMERHPGEAVPRALATKSSAWAYEEEWRSLQPDQAGQVLRFNPEVITGVVLGANCRTEDEAWIRYRIRPLGLPVERMRPDRSSFRLLREPA